MKPTQTMYRAQSIAWYDMRCVVGIDPGTKCGWAVFIDGALAGSGTWDLAARRHEGGGMRFLRLRSYLSELLDRAKPDAVFYEEVRRHMGTDAAHIYGGIVAIVQECCEARALPYAGVPVATAKKLATGKGNADKDAMIAATVARWTDFAGDDNEADARWIALAGLETLK